VEVKNLNSFKFVERALQYEIRRQVEILEEGGQVVQETRLWDASTGSTVSMRTKEEAHDYRYFPEPDLVPVVVGKEWIEELRARLPELPDEKRHRFISQYGLPEYDADLLTAERPLAEWFEEAVRSGGEPKAVSNWMMVELLRLLNERSIAVEQCPLRPQQLVEMLALIKDGTISGKIAKTVFEEMFATGKSARQVVQEKGLVQISDEEALLRIVKEVLEGSPREVERYRAGEAKLLGFFVGQVMRATKGKANPKLVNELLRRELSQ
jgi:aspartyl-tRNA(Asn)/glutamyl-tRNA(Gln) amidotransferase subunit B